MRQATLRLRDHPLEEAFERPPAPTAAPEEPTPAPPPSPLLNPDGSPIGLRRYCELVTPSWRWDWPHLRYLDGVLDRVAAGTLKRVILELPPRHGKTEKATVRHPAYRLERKPSLRIILAAHTDKLAWKFSRKIQRIVRGRIELSPEKTAADDWETSEGGGVRAVGVGTGIAGLPGDLVLVDDPFKSRKEAYSESYRDRVWEWFTEDLYTRLEPGAALVITMTRRHEDDLVGRILASENAADWVVVRLPALAEEDDPLGRPLGAALCPDRYDEAALEKIRKDIGEISFSSLYQQRPSPASGLVFKTEWLRYYTTRDHPIIEDGIAVPMLPVVWSSHLQTWDMSFKDKSDSDYVAGHFLSRLNADCYLRARTHKRMDFPATIEAVKQLTRAHPEAQLKLVEDKANGPAVISSLRSKITGLVAVEPEGDKVSRAWAVTPMFESGNVWFPHPTIAPWIRELVLELIRFPLGANDDDVDALVQGLRRFHRQIQSGMGEAPPEKGTPNEAHAVAGQKF
jgi:predicted phage terminase large subunit-like protein